MRIQEPHLSTFGVGLGLVLLCGLRVLPVHAADDFPSRMEQTLAKLATYDLGGDPTIPRAAADLLLTFKDNAAQRADLAARLTLLLQSPAPVGAKETACRILSLIGTAPSAGALAALLPDAKLSYPARYALERIPDPAAEAALVAALDKLDGKLRIGVINSLGARRSAQAAAPLARFLHDADVSTARAAAAALGPLGPAAAEPLGQALASAKPEVRSAVAAACVVCAGRLLQERKAEAAAKLFDAVREAKVDRASQIAGLRGAIVARQAAGVPLLVEQLQAADARQFALALTVARELPGVEVTQALAAGLVNLPVERQTLLLAALADRGDAAARGAVLAVAQSGAATVRVAAIGALARLGDAATVACLADAAAGEDAIAEAAQQCLATLPGQGVNEALVALAESAQGKRRQTLVELLGRRRAAVAVPLLLRVAAEADQPLRLAAVKALGETAAMRDLAALAKLLLSAQSERETAAVEAAIGELCLRTPDKDVCAGVLLATLPQGSPAAKGVVLRALAQVGGVQALQAVLAAVKDANEEVRDAAIRVLTVWPDASAAPALAALAQGTSSKKQQILALRGYIRLAGQPSVDDAQRLKMCQAALKLAERDEERKLVLGAASSIQSPAALAFLVAQLSVAALKTDAAAAAVSLGERLAKRHPREVRQALDKVLAATDNKNIARRAQALLDRLAGKK